MSESDEKKAVVLSPGRNFIVLFFRDISADAPGRQVSPENAKVVLACVGALFWITGIGGYTLLLLAHRAERRMDGKDERAKRTGIFPVNTAALILDIIFAVGVVILTLWSGKLFMQRYGAYVVLFVTTMAFHMRLLLGLWPDRGRKCSKGGMKNDRGGKKGTGR